MYVNKQPRRLAEHAVYFRACQKISELAPLLGLLQESPPRSVIEIGTFQGGTLWAWCKVAQDNARIVSIDLPDGKYGGGYPASVGETVYAGYAERGQNLWLIRDD